VAVRKGLVYALVSDPHTREVLIRHRDLPGVKEKLSEEDLAELSLLSNLLRDCDCSDAGPQTRESLIELASALISWRHIPPEVQDVFQWLAAFGRALFKLWGGLEPAQQNALAADYAKCIAVSHWPAYVPAEQPTEAPANGEGDDAPMPSLDRNGRLILEILHNRYPTLQTVEEIHGALGMQSHSIYLSDRTIRPALTKLIEDNLAERPQGERKGATLTIAGKKLAERLFRAPASSG
jgi:hypothetical protein